jgi:cytosine/adenosine deaminase-related metal-dependent hydrolase
MKLLSGGTIIAYDESTKLPKVIRGGALLIKNDRIEKIFEDTPSADSLSPNTEIIDCTNKIMSPGFIDTHRHGWQTVFKTMGPNVSLADYLWRYSALVAQPLFTPDDVYISQKLGIYEALNAGTTTILDHAHHTWTREHAAAGYNASKDGGARVYFAYDFIGAAEFPVQEALQHWRELNGKDTSDLCSLVMAYDKFSPESSSKDIQDVVALAK